MGLVQFVFGAIATYFLLVVLAFVITCVFRMLQFKKAGVEGWKAWVPFYWSYVEFDLYFKKEYFWVWLILAILAAVFSNVGFLSTLFGLAQCVLMVFLAYYKAKAYGHDTGYTIGLVLLNPVFEGILALNSDQYQGNQSKSIEFLDKAIAFVKGLFNGKKEE